MIQLGKGLFAGTLSQVTLNYIQEKHEQQGDDNCLENLDLRDTCQEVQQEMQQVQNEATFDYLKIQQDSEILGEQIDESDSILKDLEDMLIDFKINLDEMKFEMTQLQEKTSQMSTSLNNRKDFQKELQAFLDMVMLEPELIDCLQNGPINQQYAENAEKYNEVLKYLKENIFEDSVAFKEVSNIISIIFQYFQESSFQKLSNKTCGKMCQFFSKNMKQLSKQKQKFREFQNTQLLKYKIIPLFIKDNFIDLFVGVCNEYSDIMEKLHVNNLKAYVKDVSKNQIQIYTKYDTIYSDNPSNIKMTISKKPKNFDQGTHSIFHLANRQKILDEIDEKPNNSRDKLLFEQVFRNSNKYLLDAVFKEFEFISEFFNLSNDQNEIFFNGIFKSSLNLMKENFSYYMNKCYDCYAILLIMLINKKNRENANAKGIVILDSYFNSIRSLIWPRVQMVFDMQLKSMQKINIGTFLLLEQQLSSQDLLQRYIDFALSLYQINHIDESNNHMINVRLRFLRDTIMKLLINVAKQKGKGRRQTQDIYLVSCLDYIHEQFSKQDFVQEEDINFFSQELKQYIDSFVNISLESYFGDLINFVEEYAQSERQSQNSEGKKSQTTQESQTKLPVNKQLIETINKNFSYNWQVNIQKQKQFCQKYLKNTNTVKQIIKKFLGNLLGYYNSYYKYIQGNYYQYMSKIQTVNVVMKEINKQLNSLK